MANNYYVGTDDDQYKHYKIKYNIYGTVYTGGYVQDNNSTGALFGTPFKNSSCDNHDTTLVPKITTIPCFTFDFSQPSYSDPADYFSFYAPYPMSHYECYPFKKGEAPEYAMPSPEDESDIIVFQDRIFLKDVPSNTNYQIYSVIGQLMQTGTTTSD
ncbi:MAG: hypothetical protein FWG84_10150, partial [Bacteroidales bacterium]|nr:hypothetical protein [Bacteroidales bacterium]